MYMAIPQHGKTGVRHLQECKNLTKVVPRTVWLWVDMTSSGMMFPAGAEGACHCVLSSSQC